MIAEVIINTNAKSLNRPLDYIIPKDLENDIAIGSRVIVPLIKRREEAYVINIKKESKFANKEIIKIEDNILNEDEIEFAKLMARRYFCNISDCIKLMLPPGDKTNNLNKRIKDKTESFVYLNKSQDEIYFDIETGNIKTKKQKEILEFLMENEGISVAYLEEFLKTTRPTLKKLEENGYIEILQKKVERNPFKNRTVKKDNPLTFTEEQQEAFNKISNSKYKEFLIYGITGSRKNRNIFTINRRENKRRENSYYAGSRNITYSTNDR